MNKIKILDVKIDNVNFQEAVKLINAFVQIGKPAQIVTVNPEFIMMSREDDEFKDILNRAELSVPDGAGLILASRFQKQPLKERVTGIDLMLAIAKLAEKKKYPIFLLGGEHGYGSKAATALKEKHPNLIISGTYEGKPVFKKNKSKDYRSLRMTDIKPGSNDQNMEIVKKVRASRPKILFVAYGAPKQDKFIARYKHLLNVPVMMGVGGSFDYIAKKVERAPKWMQKIGLEWFWRLLKEPHRFNRIITATIRFPYAFFKNRINKS